MKQNIETKCVQSGYKPKNGDPRVLPIFQSTTYYYDTPEELAALFDLSAEGHIYTRISNPTVGAMEAKLCDLEGGVGALATSAGLAAETLAILNVCFAGDNIVSTSTIYGGSYNLFNITLRKYGIDTRFVSPDASEEEIEKLIDEKTKIIYGETIANPAMEILDFRKFASVAKKHGILFMVDNTLATPVLCRPIEYGCNVIIHSSTKYLDGHAQSVGGVIVDCGNFDFDANPRYPEFNRPDESYHGLHYVRDCGKAAFITKARVQMLRDIACCMSPFNAYLTNLGMETLHLRMKRHSENALKLAEMFEKHENVEWVRYPGLKSDKAHAAAKQYLNGGCSGMIAVGIKGGRKGANNFMRNLKLASIVTHIADVRSCVLHPATTTHRQLSDSDLIAAGISDNLVRFSVGIENAEDILSDAAQALSHIND